MVLENPRSPFSCSAANAKLERSSWQTKDSSQKTGNSRPLTLDSTSCILCRFRLLLSVAGVADQSYIITDTFSRTKRPRLFLKHPMPK